MLRRSAALVLFLGLWVCVIGPLKAAPKESETAAIASVARAVDQRPLVNYLVRLRSLDTARVVATTRTSASGEYVFRAVNAGRYGVEIVDATNKIVGTAGPFVISATGARSLATSVTLVGAGAAALAARSTDPSSKGSAAEVATAAVSAGIAGSNEEVRKRALPSCC